MKAKLTNSKGYICTLDMASDSDVKFLFKIRRDISRFNSYPGDRKGRVIAKPTKQFVTEGRDIHSNLQGGMDNAREVDLYVYFN